MTYARSIIKPIIILYDNDISGDRHGGDLINSGLKKANEAALLQSLIPLTAWSYFSEVFNNAIASVIEGNSNIEVNFILHTGEETAFDAILAQIADSNSVAKYAKLFRDNKCFVHILMYSGGGAPTQYAAHINKGNWITEIECWHAKRGKFTENTFYELYKRNRGAGDTGFLRFAPLNEDNLKAISSALLSLQLTLDSYFAQKSENMDDWISPIKSTLGDCLFTPVSDSVLSMESPGTLTKKQQNKFKLLYYSQDSGQLTEGIKRLKDTDISDGNCYGALRYFWHLIKKGSDDLQLTTNGKISLAKKALKEINDLKMILYKEKVPEGW